MEDIWLFVHLLFEIIWRNRYLYRDLPDLLTRNPFARSPSRQDPGSKVRAATQACEGLVEAGEMRASASEIAALANNMAALATCWLSFSTRAIRAARSRVMHWGAAFYQVMAMLAPFLVGDARLLLQRLSAEYLK